MGRSLKEALLDQIALLEERGLAPSEVPPEDEAPLIVVESAPRGRSTRTRRDVFDRFIDRESDISIDGEFDRDRRRGQRREHGIEDARERRRPGRAGRARRPGREGEGEFVLPSAPLAERGPAGPRQFGAGPRPMGPRPMGPRPMGPRPVGAVRPAGRTEMLQARAEQRRREDQDIAEMRQLLAELKGEEMDDAAMERFSRQLAEETGALPPPGVVVEAIKECRSAEPRKIGDAVRAYYRRRRARPMGRPAPRPQAEPAPALAGSASA